VADAITAAIKLLFIPGSLSFLLLGLTLGVVLLLFVPRARRVARYELAALALLYWLLSIPAVADLLANRFHAAGTSRLGAADVSGTDAILVLGAGVVSHSLNGFTASVPDRQTIFNAFEGARLYRAIGRPVSVIASGGVVNADWQREPESRVIRNLLVTAGVPSSEIIEESASKSTHEQAVNLAPIIRSHGWTRVIVVAPSVQMPRAVRGFAREGIDVIAAEAPFASDVGTPARSRWIPTGDALTVSARANYDYFAWFYYWIRGWL
jgi:uncharacterized SAM-binding protein YcdF (DUF218 family)